ncbi:hypothetical protein PTTG_00408 [Puccinia triticina 1-1 BBBD Race 1]|uniref:Uncharacterized protein n=1 Tax=Puccinia triticina (isolate 1-1 / race 1 (BBBD)) TaxID=630390 RepID=A0A0C4EI42_PUCT1|nr:hypothetical protein PTTG_00408 [Puccinia triticina 1-1 BBBD Race 1]
MATNGSTKTTNTRKRILDDRTNNVKTTSTASNADAKPTTKAAPLKESSTRPLTRKAFRCRCSAKRQPGLAGPSGQGKAAASKPTAIRRNALRLPKAAASNSTDNGLLEPYDAGHVAKKVRTSEPDDICKENLAEQNLAKQKPFKKDATRAGKPQLSQIQ